MLPIAFYQFAGSRTIQAPLPLSGNQGASPDDFYFFIRGEKPHKFIQRLEIPVSISFLKFSQNTADFPTTLICACIFRYANLPIALMVTAAIRFL